MNRRPPDSNLPGSQAGGLGFGAAGADAHPRDGSPAPPPEDERTRGPEADQESVARKILLDQLTGRARSRAELAGALAKKAVPADIASRLLDRFEQVGLVDDAAFAREWVTSRQAGKGLARRALATELRRKGVPDEVASAALGEVDEKSECAAARELVRARLRRLAGVDRAVAVRRLAGMLARKGYPPGTAFRIVRTELDAAGRATADLDEDPG